MFNSLTMEITEGEKKSILSGNVSEIPMDRAIIVKDFIALEMIVSKEAVHEPYIISSLCDNILQERGSERPLIAQLLAMVIPTPILIGILRYSTACLDTLLSTTRTMNLCKMRLEKYSTSTVS